MLAEGRSGPRAKQEGFHWGRLGRVAGRAGAAFVFPDSVSKAGGGVVKLESQKQGWICKALVRKGTYSIYLQPQKGARGNSC